VPQPGAPLDTLDGQLTQAIAQRDPDAGGAPRSSFSKVSTHESHASLPAASRSASIDEIPTSVSSKRIPYFETMSETGRCAAMSC
jgi:hypothetical protein